MRGFLSRRVRNEVSLGLSDLSTTRDIGLIIGLRSTSVNFYNTSLQ